MKTRRIASLLMALIMIIGLITVPIASAADEDCDGGGWISVWNPGSSWDAVDPNNTASTRPSVNNANGDRMGISTTSGGGNMSVENGNLILISNMRVNILYVGTNWSSEAGFNAKVNTNYRLALSVTATASANLHFRDNGVSAELNVTPLTAGMQTPVNHDFMFTNVSTSNTAEAVSFGIQSAGLPLTIHSLEIFEACPGCETCTTPPACDGDCPFGGVIAPPLNPPGTQITNGNSTHTNGRSALDIDVLALISGTDVKAEEIYGVEATIVAPSTNNRQLFIDVNGVSSPRYQRVGNNFPEDGYGMHHNSHGPNTNKLRFMNMYSTPGDARTAGTATPFVSAGAASFSVTIWPNNDNPFSVTSVTLLGAPTGAKCPGNDCSILHVLNTANPQSACDGTCLEPEILGFAAYNAVTSTWSPFAVCDTCEPPADPNEDIALAKTRIEAAFPATAAQELINTQAAAKGYIESLIAIATAGLDVTHVVNDTDGGLGFTAAIAGDATTPGGTDGSYMFTVTVSKGSGIPADTVLLTLNITATRFFQRGEDIVRLAVNPNAPPYTMVVDSILGTNLSRWATHAGTGWFYSTTNGVASGSQGSGIRMQPSTYPCASAAGNRMLNIQLSSSSSNDRAYNIPLIAPIVGDTGVYGVAFSYYFTGITSPGASNAGIFDPQNYFILSLSDTDFATQTNGTVGTTTTNGHLRIYHNRITNGTGVNITAPGDGEGGAVVPGLAAGWNTVYALIDTTAALENVSWYVAPVRTALSFADFAADATTNRVGTGTWNTANNINSISFLADGRNLTASSNAIDMSLSNLNVFEYGDNSFAGPGAYAPCGDCIDCIAVTSIAALVPAVRSIGVGDFFNVVRPAILPENSNPAVTWHSSDTTVATVSATGTVTGVGEGTAQITARTVALTSDGQSLTSAAMEVTVGPATQKILAEWVFTTENYPGMRASSSSNPPDELQNQTILPASGGLQEGTPEDRANVNVRDGTIAPLAGTAILRRMNDADMPTVSLFFNTETGGWLRMYRWHWNDNAVATTRWMQMEVSTLGESDLALMYELRKNGSSAPDAVMLQYSLNGGATWANVPNGVMSTDARPTELERINYLPAAVNNQASVLIRWSASRNSSGSGSIDFRNMRLISGLANPGSCRCELAGCLECYPEVWVFPLPITERPTQSHNDGSGWDKSFSSSNQFIIPSGNPSVGAANARYLVLEFSEDPGMWEYFHQDNTWRGVILDYSQISTATLDVHGQSVPAKRTLENGRIQYVIDFDTAFPLMPTHPTTRTRAALWGVWQNSFTPRETNWDQFMSHLSVMYLTNVHPSRHPVFDETEVKAWATPIAAHGGTVADTNLLQADTTGRGGLKLTYNYTATGAGLSGVRMQYSVDGGDTWVNIHRAFSIINTPSVTATGSRTEVLPVDTYNKEDLRIRWIPHGLWGDTVWGADEFTVTNAKLVSGLQISDVVATASPISGITSMVDPVNNITLNAGGKTKDVAIPEVQLSAGGTTTSTTWSSGNPVITNISNITESHATIRSFGTAGTATVRVAALADPSVYTEFEVTVEAVPLDTTIQYLITSPYEGVNWESWEQYKAAHHTHTTNSDGRNTVADTAERFYELGYSVAAITEHAPDFTSWLDTPAPNKSGLALSRLEEMAAGVGRGGKGLIFIPNSMEHSEQLGPFARHHANVYWGTPERGGGILGVLERLESVGTGGLLRINHPGRYTGSQYATPWAQAEAIARTSANFLPYADIFRSSHNVIGMEIINKFDTESQADRVLWDNILSVTMSGTVPMPVWGFSDDDSHHNNNIGFSYNLLLMPELNISEVRNAMNVGSFFAFARTDRQYGIRPAPMEVWHWPGDNGLDGLAAASLLTMPTPKVNSIIVDEEADSITINASMIQHNGSPYTGTGDFDACVVTCETICVIHPAFIHWYADGIMIAKGSTLNLIEHQLSIGSYVRASVGHRSYGVLYTQPFEVQVIHAASADIAPRALPNLTGFAQIAAPDLSGSPTRLATERSLPMAVRMNTDAADNATHPRFATITWDLSRYNPDNPQLSDIMGTISLPTGIKEVTNTGSIGLHIVFAGTGCAHNNWSEWDAEPGDEPACEETGRETRTCQTIDCNTAEYRSMPSLGGHLLSDWEDNTPEAGKRTKFCTRVGCDYALTENMVIDEPSDGPIVIGGGTTTDPESAPDKPETAKLTFSEEEIAEILEAIQNGGDDFAMTFELEGDIAAAFTLDFEALTAIFGEGVTIEFVVEAVGAETLDEGTAELVAGRPVYGFLILVNGIPVTNFGGGAITVSLPYTLGAGEDPNAILVYYLSADGELDVIRGYYNDGFVYFITEHFSMFVVGYNPVTFTDADDIPAWAAGNILFSAARKLFVGSGGNFMPKRELTYAELTAVLSNYSGNSFTATAGDWAAPHIAWGETLGIFGDKSYDYTEAVTRADMAYIIYNFIVKSGVKVSAVDDAMAFTDLGGLADEYVTAINFLAGYGIVRGTGGTTYGPDTTITREQVASIIANLVRAFSK
ncbi:MAG: S-layer homology domain-containing protein [Oscillospiraceae bacterium]|nr:S-layer homology domain-containing protein [Oscillospiraceae bacterium]